MKQDTQKSPPTSLFFALLRHGFSTPRLPLAHAAGAAGAANCGSEAGDHQHGSRQCWGHRGGLGSFWFFMVFCSLFVSFFLCGLFVLFFLRGRGNVGFGIRLDIGYWFDWRVVGDETVLLRS